MGARPGDADYDELASAIAESDSDRPRGRSGASYADDGITDMLPPWLEPAPSW